MKIEHQRNHIKYQFQVALIKLHQLRILKRRLIQIIYTGQNYLNCHVSKLKNKYSHSFQYKVFFCECNSTKCLWLELNRHFNFDFTFPVLTPQTTILGLFNYFVSNINHILLSFKFYIYKSQNKHRQNINALLVNLFKIKKLEKITTAFGNVKKSSCL